MNCAFHPTFPATAFCQSCGRGLCLACTNRFNIVKCPLCAKALNTSLSHRAYLHLAVSAVIYIACFVVTGLMTEPHSTHTLPLATRLLGTYAWGSTYWGWIALRRNGARVIIYNAGFLFFYFVAKLALSCLIGSFIAPWQIIKHIRTL